jgi:Zn-dependent peptidase ImmA (M78 family)
MKNIIKSLLRERLLTKSELDTSIIINFLSFAKKILNITDDIRIELTFKRTPDIKTTAYYIPNKLIRVYVKDRAIIDILRSLCHELVHHKQSLDSKLVEPTQDGADGSKIENEANAVAGTIIRKYGKIHPELYV